MDAPRLAPPRIGRRDRHANLRALLPCNARPSSPQPLYMRLLVASAAVARQRHKTPHSAPSVATSPPICRMHVKELAARFERPVAHHTPTSTVVSAPHLSGSSVSELRQRLEQAVIDEQNTQRRADTIQLPPVSPPPNNDALRGLSAPTLTHKPATALAAHQPEHKSPIASAPHAPSQQVDRQQHAPCGEPQTADAQHRSLLSIAHHHEQVQAHAQARDHQQQQRALEEPMRMPSHFTEAYSTNSTPSVGTMPPVSDFAPQTIDDVGIIPDVSEGELDDIDGIERVDDYDSQEHTPSSRSSFDDHHHTFQRAETLSDPQVSYRTEGGESLHIIEGSYSYQHSDGAHDASCHSDLDHNDQQNGATVVAEHVNGTPTQKHSHHTYSAYSYSPHTAPLSSFHTSTPPSQVLFSRATTSSTIEHFESANNVFGAASEHAQHTASALDATSQTMPSTEATSQTNPPAAFAFVRSPPPAAFAFVRSPPPAPSPPTSVSRADHSEPLQPPHHVAHQVHTEAHADPEACARNNLHAQASVKRLPKAKVLIARKRGQSVNLDTSTVSSAAEQPEGNVSVSEDGLGRRRLVREISNPGDFFAGQVSMVRRTSEKDVRTPEGSHDEEDSLPSPSRKPFGNLSTFHRKQLRQDAFRKKYDEYLDAEELNRSPGSDDSSLSESELLGERGASKMKYRPRMKLFGRKNAGVAKLEKERLRAKRHERRKEDIARRSTILSGALDRVSMAADPWIDFITDAKAMPVPEKTRGSLRRAVKRLFGGKGKQQTLIKD
eukprot:TRINITY_DN876_c0_g4_i1.p1 TRINITY_DN876_c0_g4~~TRINITY_DN876_c0_g4_i1.p1  ORF type:complete len:778 (-),score=149.03 TRINITY_DN876_c0_g4_i1:2001-4334(-)